MSPTAPSSVITTVPPIPIVHIERAGPGDVEALHDLFVRLSPEARRNRFFSPTPRVSRTVAVHACTADPGRHLLLLARAGGPAGTVIGEVEVVIDRHDPTSAELAIAVDGPWTRRGVARRLLIEAHALAASYGVRTFTGEVLADNRACIALLRSFGMAAELDGGVLVFRGAVQDRARPVGVRAAAPPVLAWTA
jgi:RimJ/RimL family protein N-acetyltransferase